MECIEKNYSVEAGCRRIWCIAWSHNGKILVSCGEDRTIAFWTVAPGNRLDCLSNLPNCHQRSIRHVSWSPCDRYVASASFDGSVIIWKVIVESSTLEAEAIATLEGHSSEVKCVAWSCSGHLLATCGRDRSVWFWEFDDEEDVQCVSVLQPHSQDVKCVAWHPAEDILASGSYDNTIKLYKEELDDWVVTVQLSGHDSTVWNVTFSPSGDILASCSDDRSIRLWTAFGCSDRYKDSAWSCLSVLSGYHTDTIFDLSWSPDGKLLASGGADNRLCIFRLSSPELVTVAGHAQLSSPVTLHAEKPSAHSEDVNSVAWRPSISCVIPYNLCTAADDGTISMWSVAGTEV